MIYIKINSTLYPATVSGIVADKDWDNRDTKSITLEMDHATANELFINGATWSIVYEQDVPVYQTNENGEAVLDEHAQPVQIGTEKQTTEYDNSDYNLAGDITDHRDGTITVKMGALTELEEAYEIMLGGIE